MPGGRRGEVDGTRKARAVERIRCTLCRNPIKSHQVAAGPDSSYHEDCWPAAAEAAARSSADQQSAYRKRIGEEGLAGLLSPYISVFPPQQSTFAVKPEHAPATEDLPVEAQASDEIPAQRSEPNFVML